MQKERGKVKNEETWKQIKSKSKEQTEKGKRVDRYTDRGKKHRQGIT
jgi:hypothetical protein